MLKLSLIASATVVSIASAKVTLIASFIGVDCLIAGLGKSVWNRGLESEHETEEAYGIHILKWSSKKLFSRVDNSFC